MSLWRLILQDLDVLLSESAMTTRESRDMKSTIDFLRCLVMYIIPFWNDCPWKLLSSTRPTKVYEQMIKSRLEDFVNRDEFVDYWKKQLYCYWRPRCSVGNECLFHAADVFYSNTRTPFTVESTEHVLECLESVQCRNAGLSLAEESQLNKIKQGLTLLTCFRKSMALWDFENWEQTRALTCDRYKCAEDLPRRAIIIYKMASVDDTPESKRQAELSSLVNEIRSCLCDWRNIRKLKPLNLTLEYPNGVEYESLFCFTDDLRILLKTLLVDIFPLPSGDIGLLLVKINNIRYAVKRTWMKIFLESGMSYAVARNIYTLTGEAYDAASLNAQTEKSSHMLSTQQKLTDIRDDVNKIYIKHNLASNCIGDFLKCATLILEDDVLSKSHVGSLSLLHTFIRDTENLFNVNPKILNTYHQIKQMFYDAWWNLWSVCLGELSCRKDFHTMSRDILIDFIANMPQPSDLLLDLIETLVQMPKADELVHELRIALVKMGDDNLFAKLLYSLEKNLAKLMDSDASTDHVETFKTEGPVVLISGVEAELLEAADVYILFFRDSEDDLPSSTVEVVDGFKASVRHAYAEYVKLPEMETPMSELEFFDMLVNMREFRECNGYFSDRIGALSDDLSTCFSVLQQNTFRHVKPGEVKHLWTQIMKLGRKVEHMIDTFKELPNWFSELRMFSVSEEVKLIKENLSKFSRDEARDDQRKQGQTIDRSKDEAGNDQQTQDKDHIVSFEEESSLTTQLTTGSKRLEKIAVVGMPGLGKTTLALNLYKDCAKFFYAHAWCHVGQDFERKELLRDITGQISERPSSEINVMREEDLAKLLKQSLLKKKNYLIVLDDLWDVEAWNALQICFPLGNNGSRILLTSRSKTIGERVCGDRNVLELNLLSTDKSWNLLQKKVFGAKKCPQTLSQIGEGIAKKCDGLPLSIVVIAGVLKNKEKTEKIWYEVAESLDTYLVDGVLNTLELSYTNLSVGMKQCFLYCITFLKGKEIPRSKLVQICLAERFVEKSDKQESLEAAAEKYLSDLVDRSLLMVAKTGSDKRFQAFRIHDLLHDFCVQKAKEEKFMITINGWDDPAGRQRCSRLCFRSSQDRFPIFKCKEESWQQTIRSLTTSAYRSWFGERCDTSFIFENFKSLTLLDLESVAMDDAMSGSVAGLKSLRFLAIRGCMDRIPSSIGELFNLETLIVKGTRGEVDIPETIFKLRKLRHLKVTKRAYVRVEHKTLTSLNTLHSLQSFSTPILSWSPGEQIIKQFPNLRKLRCIFLHESSDLSILNCLCHLESLRVLYHGLGRFSGGLSFPSNLYKLTLFKFRLPWSEIEKIATLLPRLEILKLLFKAFEGHKWTTKATFENLKYLRMEELDIKEWEASDDNFPRLERLIVRRCKLLHKIPEDLGNIGDLMGIEAHWCKASVGKSALKIKKRQINDGNMKFETIIYPTVLDLDDDDDELSE